MFFWEVLTDWLRQEFTGNKKNAGWNDSKKKEHEKNQPCNQKCKKHDI